MAKTDDETNAKATTVGVRFPADVLDDMRSASTEEGTTVTAVLRELGVKWLRERKGTEVP